MTAIHAIETRYKGLTFRSRLEATWAAFFDLWGWEGLWKYEPIDLNGYIPDFIMDFPWAPLLIEVKPAVALKELWDHADKIEKSGWKHDALIVGAGLFRGEDNDWQQVSGLLSQKDFWDVEQPQDIGWCWGNGIVFRCLRCGLPSVHHADHSWNCYICGAYEGNAHIGPLASNETGPLWAKAHTLTRWRPRQ